MFTAVQAASVTVKPFGKTPDGQAVHLYTLTNRTGANAAIATYGGTVVNLHVPDREGRLADVVLGFDTIDPYFTATAYFGALNGRYANRIGNGQFTLEGNTHRLAKNNGSNTLHGGLKGFDKHVWEARIVSQDPPAIELALTSPDGDENFPGTLKVAAVYTFTDGGELRIEYRAETDRPTVVNLTNHSYFNLAGHGDVLGHKVRIHADRFTPVDETLIPTGEIAEVAGTPLDFRKWTAIGSRLDEVAAIKTGYDHNYVLNKPPEGGMALAAEVWEPKSGRLMEVYTDEPGMQFYTGNFLDGITGKAGRAYREQHGFCMETQHFPDSPNHAHFPSTVLRPGEEFRSTTVYKFGTK